MDKIDLKISATDLKQWCFCPRQWYFYKTTGRRPKFNKAIKRGLDYHRVKGEAVDSVIKAQSNLKFFLKAGARYVCYRSYFIGCFNYNTQVLVHPFEAPFASRHIRVDYGLGS